MAASAAAIEFIGVDKRFGLPGTASEVLAARDVNFSVAVGEVVSIIGPSGCGKSTLLNMGSGLAKPSKGVVKVNGEMVSGPNKHVAFMLQKDLLMPWRTISENVEFGLELRSVPRAERAEISTRLLAKCHLKGFGEHYPNQLSGGMRQRAALARTLAVDPLVLLMDEPFSALDPLIREHLQQELLQLQKTLKKTIVFVSHDLAVVDFLADRIAVMNHGEIVEQGDKNQILRNPQQDYTKRLIAAVPVPDPDQQQIRRETRLKTLKA